MCCAFSFVMWGCGGVANVCIALHMWCAEHCTCGALHVAHVPIIALYVFVRCSSARVVEGPETGTAIPAMGEDCKAEPDARPLRRSTFPEKRAFRGSQRPEIVDPHLVTVCLAFLISLVWCVFFALPGEG